MSDLSSFQSWFTAHGGSFHPSVVLEPQGPYGISVLAPKISEDTTIVTCPFSLIISKDISLHAIRTLLGPDAHSSLDSWSERQLISSYMSLHQLFSEQSAPAVLRHLAHIKCLPPTEKLTTPLHFTQRELEFLKGTNLYGATIDRTRDLRVEWAQCQSLVQSVNPTWGDAFTWEIYLTASTHLSSRAFPSTILSSNPSLVSSTSTYPVLIPGVEFMNHKRGQPVSWIVSCQDAVDDSTTTMSSTSNTVSILVHPKSESVSEPSTEAGLEEVFNNYGPKPNDELILGFGFSLPDNPDDKITLQLGGSAQKWDVGRNAFNIDGLWSEVRNMLPESEFEFEFERDLATADELSNMVEAKLNKMRTVEEVRDADDIRPAVKTMLEHYIAGQIDILQSILEFSEEKQKLAIKAARDQGIEIVMDEDTDSS